MGWQLTCKHTKTPCQINFI